MARTVKTLIEGDVIGWGQFSIGMKIKLILAHQPKVRCFIDFQGFCYNHTTALDCNQLLIKAAAPTASNMNAL